MAFLAEQAGGMAVDGVNRVMDIEPDHLHQRIPFFCGSRNDVQVVQEIFESESRRKKNR
jgi:fructose-1,6-bisphosphatase I